MLNQTSTGEERTQILYRAFSRSRRQAAQLCRLRHAAGSATPGRAGRGEDRRPAHRLRARIRRPRAGHAARRMAAARLDRTEPRLRRRAAQVARAARRRWSSCAAAASAPMRRPPPPRRPVSAPCSTCSAASRAISTTRASAARWAAGARPGCPGCRGSRFRRAPGRVGRRLLARYRKTAQISKLLPGACASARSTSARVSGGAKQRMNS